MDKWLSCSACGKEGLSPSGYWSHLRQSKRPECAALYRELRFDTQAPTMTSNTDELFSTTNSISSEDGSNDDEPQPHPFAGDAFGSPEAYQDDDFGQSIPSASEPASNDEEEEDEDLEALQHQQQEAGWEPDRTNHETLEPLMEIDEEEDDSDGVDGFASPPPSASPINVAKYSAAYPHKLPGKPIGQMTSDDAAYQAMLESSPQPYAPFISRIDWEMAKWAKLRGPGSTAFSELLQIEGVRIPFIP